MGAREALGGFWRLFWGYCTDVFELEEDWRGLDWMRAISG